MITLAILGLLASLATPTITLISKRQKEQELKSRLMEIRRAIDAYKKAVDDGKIMIDADESGYPPTLSSLYKGVKDASDPDSRKIIFFMRRLPRDPFFPDTFINPEDTWGKRSYESSYESPKEGKDVYDVYSLSPNEAINGTKYKSW